MQDRQDILDSVKNQDALTHRRQVQELLAEYFNNRGGMTEDVAQEYCQEVSFLCLYDGVYFLYQYNLSFSSNHITFIF